MQYSWSFTATIAWLESISAETIASQQLLESGPRFAKSPLTSGSRHFGGLSQIELGSEVALSASTPTSLCVIEQKQDFCHPFYC